MTRTGALEELRVVEWAGADLGVRLAARLFADFGAQVFQICEQNCSPNDSEVLALRRLADSGKQLIAPSDPRVEQLILSADVLFESRSQPLPESLRRVALANSALVQVCLSPLGSFGDLAAWQADALQVCALSGTSIALGELGHPPLHFPFGIPSFQTAFHAAAAALVALRARERQGRGQAVEVAAADILARYAAAMFLFVDGCRGSWIRRGFERHGPSYPSGFYPCQDGFVFIAALSQRPLSQSPWAGFLKLMGDPEWARSDPALRDGAAIGWERADEVDLQFIPWLLQFPRKELIEKAAAVDGINIGPVNSVHELLDEEHLSERGIWTEVDIDGTQIRLPGLGYKLSRTPWHLGPAPQPITDLPEPRPTTTSRGFAVANPARPLDGLRVIEFGWNVAGPMVGQMLADFGAEVLRVETARRPDYTRTIPHSRAHFEDLNRNKRSIAVDVATTEGAQLIHRLARVSDIVFDNFAAGVLARYGLGEEALRTTNSKLIVLSMAMAGQTGPLRHVRGFATICTGFAGLEHAIGYPNIGPTGLPLIPLGDLNAAIQAVFAILVALHHRERTGEGQFIDLSQIEAACALMAEPLIRFQLCGEKAEPCANAHPKMAPHGTYPAAGNDRWIAISVRHDADWQALVDVMGFPEWACAEALARTQDRLRCRDEIDRHLSEWSRLHDRDQLAAALQAAGVPAAPVLEMSEVFAHPHFKERGLELRWQTNAAPEGAWRLYNTPWHLSATPRQVRSPAPALGADNAYVFGEILNLPERELRRLVQAGVIR